MERFENLKTVEDVKAAIERDPVAFMFAVWDAEAAEGSIDGDDDPPPASASPAQQVAERSPRNHCDPTCPCRISFAVGDPVRTNRFLPQTSGTVERLGKRMPGHETGFYVYVRFDQPSGEAFDGEFPASRAFFGGFDLVREGMADPFVSPRASCSRQHPCRSTPQPNPAKDKCAACRRAVNG